MYYVGVTFYHKQHPLEDVIAPKSLIWRKRGEGLYMTAKGKKVGNNGLGAKFFVAISYNKGVVLCEQWDSNEKFNGANYNKFIKEKWEEALRKSNNSKNKLVLQDGCPVQNSKKANLAYDNIGYNPFSIPPRSPDLNPIENMFHLVRVELAAQAERNNITTESFEQFSLRVKGNIGKTSFDVIDKTIESMPKRIQAVFRSKGIRTKY